MTLDFGSWALDNRSLVKFIVAVLLLGGLFSAYKMSKLEDPEVTVKLAVVVSTYPGASAHELELQVVDPLEKALMTIGELDIVQSTVYQDFAISQIALKSTVKEDEVQQCWDKLRRKVSDLQQQMPSGASFNVQDEFGLLYSMFYAFTGDGLSDSEMEDYAEMIQREITNIPSVAGITVFGKRTPCIDIDMVPEKIATLGVSPVEVLATLNGQTSAYYAGYFENGDKRVRVAVGDRFEAVKEISDMIIQGHENDQLRISDIATVKSSFAEPVRTSMTYNGKKAIGIAIAGASGTDIVKVGKEVKERMAQLEKDRLPLGAEFHKIFFQPEQVTSALSTFLLNLAESILIVVACLMVTMGFRSGIIIGFCLLVTVIGSFLLLYQADGTMQRVSLGSFILAMGMLVDNSIVIVDGILVGFKKGEDKKTALVEIGKKTALPLLGATMIASIAFLPVFLSPDTAGLYVRDLFIVLAVSLLLSWFLALTHVPMMCDRLLKVPAAESGPAEELSSEQLYSGRTYTVFRRVLTLGLRHRVMSVAVITALVALSAVGYFRMKNEFFPDMEYKQCYMEYKLPEGTSPERVHRDLEEIEAYLHTRDEIVNVVAAFGQTPARYNLVRSVSTPSLSYGELIVDFKSSKLLEKNIEDIQRHLQPLYPDAYLKFKRYNIMYKKYPIEVRFSGPDPAVLHRLAEQTEAIMEENPTTRLVTTDWEPKVPVLSVDYRQPEARRAGLSRQDVALSMMTASGGIPIGSFYEGTTLNAIYLKCTGNDGEPLENLENVPVFSTIPNVQGLVNKDLVIKIARGSFQKSEILSALLGTSPLRQISDGVSVDWEDPVICHYNNRRAQTVMCSPIDGVVAEDARKDIASKIEALELPVGYSMDWEGEKGASDQTMSHLFSEVPLGVILIIGILIMLFRDFKKPTIILLGIPMLAIGIVSAMLLTGKSFTFCSIVGALGLVGMMVKNGIVLLDEIDEQMKTADDPVKALVESSVSRLRPVMMASLTTILGMLPLLSDAMFGSMAATIMGGLTFSTIATLIYVPVFYSMFFRVRCDGKK